MAASTRTLLVLLVATLGVALTAPAAQSSGPDRTTAQIAKKCKKRHGKKKCKKKPPPAPPAPPAPLALTEPEVINRMAQQASFYCSLFSGCSASGYYVDEGGHLACESKATYRWACYGFTEGETPDYLFTCDFREIVLRSGYSDITSFKDLTFGSSGGGWDCTNFYL